MSWPPLSSPDLNWVRNDTPHAINFGDIYYSPEEGEAEASFVFLEGINASKCWENSDKFSICELGFGTGLNFLKTWELWEKTKKPGAFLDYVSIEGHPLSKQNLEKALSKFPKLKPYSDQLLREWPITHPGFTRIIFPQHNIRLTLAFGAANQTITNLSGPFNAWYLDGFSPKKNPEMWSDIVFETIKKLSLKDTQIATFSAAGFIKRGLEGIDFKVTKTKGFGRKRERIIAQNQIGIPRPSKTLYGKTVAIIGGGIAGASLAHSLKKRGAKVTIIDKTGKIGSQTSGNPVALMSPKFNLHFDTYGRFFPQAFIYTSNLIRDLEKSCDKIYLEPKGMVTLAKSEKERLYQKKLIENLNWPTSEIKFLSEEEITKISDFKAPWGGLHIPNAGSINTQSFLKALTQNTNIIMGELQKIEKKIEGWSLFIKGQKSPTIYDKIVFANALESFDHLSLPCPLIPNRGQITYIPEMNKKITSSFGGYLTPPINLEEENVHILGATYDQWNVQTHPNWATLRESDHTTLLDMLNSYGLKTPHNKNFKGRASLRATTLDHMPIAGPITNPSELEKIPKHIYKPTPNDIPVEALEKGLFILSGLGSRGFQTAPLLSEYIASLMDGTPFPIDKEVANSLHPARFKLKSLRN